jgi:hypothetical protein
MSEHNYDPTVRIEFLTDLDKLKAIPDPELAGYLEALFVANVNRPLRATRGQLLLPLEARKVG